MNRFFRFAVLACSLPLALPQGWCCLLAIELSRFTSEVSAKPASCCACADKEETTTAPAEKPTRLPPGKCPCDDRHTVLLEKSSVEKPDLDFAFVLPVGEDLIAIFTGVEAEAVCVRHPPTFRLHVFECVWLC
jgi:hypothetical protein